jgi:hypothetical protein
VLSLPSEAGIGRNEGQTGSTMMEIEGISGSEAWHRNRLFKPAAPIPMWFPTVGEAEAKLFIIKPFFAISLLFS